MNQPLGIRMLSWREPSQPPELLNPIVLAYIGDAIYEMHVRQYVISMQNHRPNVLHKRSSAYVSAKSQAKALNGMLSTLTVEEMSLIKKGRNAKSGTVPKNTEVGVYRQSTAFECLLGYLYYSRQFERLESIMNQAIELLNREPETAEFGIEYEVNGREEYLAAREDQE